MVSLKGDIDGHLLTFIEKDGNNQMMPIAYVVVEAETIDSWSSFIDLLLSYLNGIQQKKMGFYIWSTNSEYNVN